MEDQPRPNFSPPPRSESSIGSIRSEEEPDRPPARPDDDPVHEIGLQLRPYQQKLATSIVNLLDVEDRWEDGEPPDTVSGYVKGLATFREKKRLFVCCDGTWNDASGTIAPLTNVAKLARCVDRIGHDELDFPTKRSRLGSGRGTRFGLVRQLVYYSRGVGTHSSFTADNKLSGATGHGT